MKILRLGIYNLNAYLKPEILFKKNFGSNSNYILASV